MVVSYDFTKNITNPFIHEICDEVKVAISHELMSKLILHI
jgi:hypothetical protein